MTWKVDACLGFSLVFCSDLWYTCPWMRTKEPLGTGAATQEEEGNVLSSPLNSSSLSVPTCHNTN